jgi:hypothetical protein
MPDSLKNKIEKVEEEHFQQAETDHIERHDQIRRDAAMRFLGGAMALDRLKEHLSSQVISAIMAVEEHNLYKEFGFERFADFLDKSELSPMSKSQFYRLKELYVKEGPANYDLLTEWNVPLSTRKLLTATDIDIVIEGDEVVIGGEERVNIAESRTIKAIIEKLVKEKTTLAEDLNKQEAKLEKEQIKNKRGTDELNELRRSIDAANEGTEYERALMATVKAFITLATEAKALPDDERAERGAADLQTLAGQYFALSDAFGVKRPLHDNRELQERIHEMKPVEEMTEEEKQATFLDRASAIIDEEGGFEDLD